MRLSIYIAKRYLFAKKSHNIINIISIISVIGITIGTAALIIVLSVFNGFENVVVGMFNSFNPDLLILPKTGKTFHENEIAFGKLYKLDGVGNITKVIEENALLKYRDKQYIATIKAVTNEFHKTSRIDSMVVDGNSRLEHGEQNFAIVGEGISYFLALPLNDYENPISVFVPRRFKGTQINPMEAFTNLSIQPSGIFSIQQEYDQKYMIVPLRFGRELLEYTDELTALEIKAKSINDIEKVKKQIQSVIGDKFMIKNRYEQEETMYKIMKSEKLAVFVILSFILLIAIFNVIGSLSMLILDKKKDISILKSLGANRLDIRNIFFTEGMMITLLGAIVGLGLGGLICWVQQTFGLLTINTGSTFVIEAYPVRMLPLDFVYVLGIVTFIGSVAAWYPVKYISKKHIESRLD
ncbi:MAG: FtsX-like permease family protein [Bacteroidota bacterium]